MLAWLMARWRGPREPLAGVALAAMAGVGAAEAWRMAFVKGYADAGAAPWIAAGMCMGLLTAWGAWRRAWLFWGVVTAGFAALHLFQTDPLPAQALARRLARPATAFLDEQPGSGFHLLRGVGTVTDAPRATATEQGVNWRFTLALDVLQADGDPAAEQPGAASVTAEWRAGPPALAAGDRVELRAALAANVAGPRNPGEFDEAGYLRRQGVLSRVRMSGLADARLLPRPPGFGWYTVLRLAHRCRDWMEARLSLDLRDDPEAGAVVAATLLGLRGPPGLGELTGPFQRTGTLHYFAVDGLKLGLLAFLLLQALRFFGWRGAWAGATVLPLLAGYTLATGLGAASARAVAVAGVFVGGQMLDRPPRPLNSLGAAAGLILLFDTQQLFSLGFQLSFLVVLAILTLSGSLRERLLPLGAPDPFLPRRLYSAPLRAWESARRRVVELASVALGAWLGSLPLVFLDFHVVSLVSPLANVAVFPLAVAVLALGVLSLAGGWMPGWSLWMNNANWLAARGMLLTVRGFDALPGGSFPLAAPEHWHWERPALEAVVLDLGPARASLVRAGTQHWLFDAARPFEYRRGVRACLDARAVARLDGLLLTQGDADHLGGALLALADLRPARLVVGAGWSARSPTVRALRELLAGGAQAGGACGRGDTVALAPGVAARVLYPPVGEGGAVPDRAAADRALVLRTEAAGWRVLALGEGDGAAARWLRAHEAPGALASEVLITAPPVSAELLAAVHPRLVILQPPTRKGHGGEEAPPLPPGTVVFPQTACGAVTLRVYTDRLEAEGFVDGRRVVLRK